MIFNIKKKKSLPETSPLEIRRKWDAELFQSFFKHPRNYNYREMRIGEDGRPLEEKKYQAVQHKIIISGFKRSIVSHDEIEFIAYGHTPIWKDFALEANMYAPHTPDYIQTVININSNHQPLRDQPPITEISPGTEEICLGRAYLGPYTIYDIATATLEITLWISPLFLENIKEIFRIHREENTLPELNIRLILPEGFDLGTTENIIGTPFYIERIWMEGITCFSPDALGKNLIFRNE